MPIEHAKGGATVLTGKAIDLYNWAALASALRLQAKTGMRPNRHVNPRKVAKEWLQVRTNDFGLLITMVEAKVKELQSQVTHIYEE